MRPICIIPARRGSKRIKNKNIKLFAGKPLISYVIKIAKKSKLDLNKTYKGIAVSSGNSFVHETESQVILNGSYNINFTMDLVQKDMNLFNELSKKLNTPLEISPFILDIFKDAQKKYGSRAWSSMVVKRLEDKFGLDFRSDGFPDELVDDEKEEKGYEI